MHDPIPSCFRGGAKAAPPPSTATGPTLTTSIYETHLGLAALTWSRTVLGLSLRAEIRLPSMASCSSSSSVSTSSDCTFSSFHFRLRPWLLWKRRGTKRFHLKGYPHSTVDFAWDLSHATFPAAGGPEPSSGFFVAVAVDGEIFITIGDLESEAYKKTETKKPIPWNPVLISRREHVVLADSGAGRLYTTWAKMGGKEREITVDLGGGGEKDSRMCVVLDGKRVLQVKRLRWKFRGNERVEVDGGAGIQVSWDVHNWLFNHHNHSSTATSSSVAAASSSSEHGHAMFVFRFDKEEAEKEVHFGKRRNGGTGHGSGGKSGGLEWSTSSIGGGGGKRGAASALGRKTSLLKTSSFSSSSSSSSGSSWSVMEWASPEENELKESDGLTLLVCVWKR